MQSVLVIFNGIRFPYYLMEFGIGKAKAHSASLHGLFLQAKSESDEGYGFPSDLDQAVDITDAADARKDDKQIIRDHIKMAANMAAAENVPFTWELMTGSSLSEVIKVCNNFDQAYLDAAFDDDTPSMLTNNSFTSNDLMKQASIPVQLIAKEA